MHAPLVEHGAMLAICKAFAHPVRIHILMALSREPAASSVRIAETLDLPATTVRHHTNALLTLGMITLAFEAPARGAIERFYQLSGAAQEALPFLQLASLALNR
jgi:predicted ArsR family transcriptional regulator